MGAIRNQAQYISTKKLKLLENNPRTINKKQFDTLKKSIEANKDYFEARPIIASDRTGELVVIAGNQRLKAARALDMAEVPTVVLHGLTEERERELIIRDNVSNGDWDMDILANEWDAQDLEDWGLDIGIDKEPSADDIEEVEEVAPTEDEPKSRLGEIYHLGRHRLICGDSLEAETLDRLLDGQSADMLLTDPPYNVDYEGGTGMKLKNDNMSNDNFVQFLEEAFRNASNHMKAGAPFYIWHADLCRAQFCEGLDRAGWTLREVLVWVKNSLVLGRQDYQWQHEPCLYGWKDGAAHHFVDDRTITTIIDSEKPAKEMTKAELVEILDKLRESVPTTVIREKRPVRSQWHPTTKPIALMAKLIANSSKQGDRILDSFGGSGSTLLAAEQMNRTAYLCELDPKYCDAIRKRWQIMKTGSEEGWEEATPAES